MAFYICSRIYYLRQQWLSDTPSLLYDMISFIAVKKEVILPKKALRYIGIILYPTIVSGFVVLLWKVFLYDNGLYFSPDAEAPILYMIIPLVGFIYVIFASLAVNSVFEKHKQISRSVVRKDVSTYLEHRDQQLPVLMHILVAMPSMILLFLALSYHYADFHAGIAAVFLVTFVVSLTWVVINGLDNAHKKAYSKASVPPHWHKKKPEEHFQENKL